MTWWNRAEPTPEPVPAVIELHRTQLEMQGDITFLYDQLKRINDRLKQRASRAARDGDGGPDNGSTDHFRSNGSDLGGPALVGEEQSSSSLAASDPSQSLLTKEQVRELFRHRQSGRSG